MVFRLVALAFQQVDIGGARPEEGDLLVVHELPHGAKVGISGVAVEEDDLRADPEGGDEPVPHHPGRGGHVDNRVIPLQVAWRTSSFNWLIRMPPTLWTMHFGLPVVPEENMM